MVTSYDNTDSGAVFPPNNDAKVILQGKINNDGNEELVAMIMSKTKDGKQIIDVYGKVGTLFANAKTKDSAPDFTGPFHNRRIAVWKKQKNEMKYMSCSISDTKERQDGPTDRDSDIPY